MGGVTVVVREGALTPAQIEPPCENTGAVVSFEGVVRRAEHNHPVEGLDYVAYRPLADRALEQLASEATERFSVRTIHVEHSQGFVAVGQCSFRLVVTATHRREALDAMDWFIDRLKVVVPIWKKAVLVNHPIEGPIVPLETKMGDSLTHLSESGAARMVDVGGKPSTRRTAIAEARVRCNAPLIQAIRESTLAKGDLLAVARVAGIMAAKRVDLLIPLCHTLPIEQAHVDISLDDEGVRILAQVSTTAKTGVEMEALSAVMVAALTVIDMGKALDKSMTVENVRLLEKSGGASGDFRVDS